MEIARAHGADDLEVFALSLLGRAEVNAGRREHGMELLEEAMAAATAGRVRNVHTLAEAYCNLIEACAGAGEWERANEWCELVDDFARTHATAPLFGACRTVHADVLMAAGRWPEAEHALESALATHERYVPEMGAPAIARMAELRVRQGRLAEAAQLLAGARGAARRRCGRSPCSASPRTGRRWRPRCSSAACGAPRATPSAPPSCWRRSSTPASPAATWPAPARPPASSPRSRRRPASG